MFRLDDLDSILLEAGWYPEYLRLGRHKTPTQRMDLGGGLTTDVGPAAPEAPEPAPFPLDKRRETDEDLIYGVPMRRWKYMTPEQQQAAITKWKQQEEIWNKIIQASADKYAKQAAAAPAQPAAPAPQLPPHLPKDTTAIVGDRVLGQPQKYVMHPGPGSPIGVKHPVLAAPVNKGVPADTRWYSGSRKVLDPEDEAMAKYFDEKPSKTKVGVDEFGNYVDMKTGKALYPTVQPKPVPRIPSPEEQEFLKRQQAYDDQIAAAWNKYHQDVEAAKSQNRSIRGTNQEYGFNDPLVSMPGLPYTPSSADAKKFKVAPGEKTVRPPENIDDLVKMGYLDKVPPVPVRPSKPEKVAPMRPAQTADEVSSGNVISTPEGPTRAFALPVNDETEGFYVYDEMSRIPMDGPFATEHEAQQAIKDIANRIYNERLSEQEEQRGTPLNPAQRKYLQQQIWDSLSWGYRDPKDEKSYWETKDDPIKQARHRDYELADDTDPHNPVSPETPSLRATQLKMWQQGRDKNGNPVVPEDKLKIVKVADENPPGYLDAGRPTAEHLKKVWCPLILDKANPPQKPWTMKQLTEALYPLMKKMARQWVGQDYDEDQAIEDQYLGLLKAILNDRGIAPFYQYAKNYMFRSMRRAKKTEMGAIRRGDRAPGWGNSGLSSLDAPLKNSEGMEDGSLADTVGASRTHFEKVDCPECGGKGKLADEEGTVCTNCDGVGTDEDGNPCPLCKREPKPGFIAPSCPACKGTGRWTVVSDPSAGTLARNDRGELIDAATIAPTIGKKGGGFKQDQLSLGDLEVEKRPDGSYQVEGPISPDEKVELQERLGMASRLVNTILDRMMSNGQLNDYQREIISLRFGLPSSMKPNGGSPLAPSEVATALTRSPKFAKEKPPSSTFIDNTIKKIIPRMRNFLANSKDKDLFDLYDRYQRDWGLQDIQYWDDRLRAERGELPLAGYAELPDVEAAEAEYREVGNKESKKYDAKRAAELKDYLIKHSPWWRKVAEVSRETLPSVKRYAPKVWREVPDPDEEPGYEQHGQTKYSTRSPQPLSRNPMQTGRMVPVPEPALQRRVPWSRLPKRIASYRIGKDPELVTATSDGEYGLYNWGSSKPIQTINLKQGDQVGFRKGQNGQITAVAGSESANLKDGDYAWRIIPKAQPKKEIEECINFFEKLHNMMILNETEQGLYGEEVLELI